MNRKQRADRRAGATAHRKGQAVRKAAALMEATTAAKRAKKGAKGVVAEMLKRGYRQDEFGRWLRLPKQDEVAA